ncbi:TPA: hypothetical protein JI136_04015 [Acinetobacter baumannii]|nr:hypothetical protein AZE33_10330 [Acinetobacter baumannii]MDB0160205.1 hypothetical protein [Escherichia coli]MDB0262147.1 hypothetical protein [Acinetobacter baumannii]MDB0305722.1 hypothetical protein [Acinetobacter baumannii]OID13307.1 hypothetical protein A7L28_15825 [Acinetobacter baumannii]
MNFRRQNPIWRTVLYDRNIGSLNKKDYEFIRNSLENYLSYLQSIPINNHDEIDKLKIFFIKLDHHIDRM